MPRAVPLRGVVEGFYGPPWSPEDDSLGAFTLEPSTPMILVRAGAGVTRVTMEQMLPFRDRRLE